VETFLKPIGHLRKSVDLDPKNFKALYALAEETERQATGTSDAGAEKLFASLVDQRSGNVAVLLEVARLAAKTGDSASLRNAVSKLAEASVSWPEEAKQQMALLQQASAGSNPRAAASRVSAEYSGARSRLSE
jgi:thioredoxin-like negative regulator of GroEL